MNSALPVFISKLLVMCSSELIFFFFLAILGLRGCAGFSLAVVCKLLIAVASLVAEHGLEGSWAQ